MKRWPVLMAAAVCLGPAKSSRADSPSSVAAGVECGAVAGFTLSDQYDRPHVVTFPRTNLTVFTIADRQGSEQIDGWVAAIKERYGTRVQLAGVADVASVPWALRGLVRRKFREVRAYPVMLDWGGTVTRMFGCTPGQVNVFLVDDKGRVRFRAAGLATASRLQPLFAIIDAAPAKVPEPR